MQIWLSVHMEINSIWRVVFTFLGVADWSALIVHRPDFIGLLSVLWDTQKSLCCRIVLRVKGHLCRVPSSV